MLRETGQNHFWSPFGHSKKIAGCYRSSHVHAWLVDNNNDLLQVPNGASPRGRGERVPRVSRNLPFSAWANHYAKVDDEHEQDGQVCDDNEADVDDNHQDQGSTLCCMSKPLRQGWQWWLRVWWWWRWCWGWLWSGHEQAVGDDEHGKDGQDCDEGQEHHDHNNVDEDDNDDFPDPFTNFQSSLFTFKTCWKVNKSWWYHLQLQCTMSMKLCISWH